MDAILKRGDIGLGESYMAGLWESPDLKSFLTFCQRNRDEFARLTRFDFVNTVASRWPPSPATTRSRAAGRTSPPPTTTRRSSTRRTPTG